MNVVPLARTTAMLGSPVKATAPPAIGPITRTLRVLSAVCQGGPSSLSELAASTKLAPSTLLRTLRLMQDEGFVVQDGSKTWRATSRVGQLGRAVNDDVGMSASSAQILHDLACNIDESVVYASYEDGWLTYAGQGFPDRDRQSRSVLGGRYGALETQTGKVILGFLPALDVDTVLTTQCSVPLTQGTRQILLDELRGGARRGYAAGVGRRWPGLWGVAAPVFDGDGRPAGAIGAAVPLERSVERGREHCAGLVHAVVSAAGRLTELTGGRQPAWLVGSAQRRRRA